MHFEIILIYCELSVLLPRAEEHSICYSVQSMKCTQILVKEIGLIYNLFCMSSFFGFLRQVVFHLLNKSFILPFSSEIQILINEGYKISQLDSESSLRIYFLYFQQYLENSGCF